MDWQACKDIIYTFNKDLKRSADSYRHSFLMFFNLYAGSFLKSKAALSLIQPPLTFAIQTKPLS